MDRALLALMFLISIASLLACGSQQMAVADAADMALNTITDAAQPTYELTRAWCDKSEWEVVQSDRTPAQKTAAVAKIRSRCDEIFEAFTEIIRLQKAARAIVDASRSGTGDALLALAKVKEVQVLLSKALEMLEQMRES